MLIEQKSYMPLVSIPSLFFVCAMFLSAEKNYIDDRTTNLVIQHL